MRSRGLRGAAVLVAICGASLAAGCAPDTAAAAPGAAAAAPIAGTLTAAGPAASGATTAADPPRSLDPEAATRFARLALACVHLEYPNKISHVLASDADARPPRSLTPAFYGCLDWHSAVHGHWLLARVARLQPGTEIARAARAALGRSLTPANVAGEVEYFRRPDRASFERPYGLAWLLQLAAELRQWDDPVAREWSATLAPLETEVVARQKGYLPKLRYPIRVGEHSQTAFALGLVYDWALVSGDDAMRSLVASRAREWYQRDRACPLAYEPSGEDFLSPCLAEADLMRRVLPATEYAAWLGTFLPGVPKRADATWLPVAIVTDRTDPKLAHLDGLNLSRAWMLRGMERGLPAKDSRRAALAAAAQAHADAALPAVTGEHYEGGHWLGTFALYLVSSH